MSKSELCCQMDKTPTNEFLKIFKEAVVKLSLTRPSFMKPGQIYRCCDYIGVLHTALKKRPEDSEYITATLEKLEAIEKTIRAPSEVEMWGRAILNMSPPKKTPLQKLNEL